MNQIKTHIVPPLDAPIRLQEYGVGIFEAAPTKSALKKALKQEYITVNNVIASTATYINGGERIQLRIPEKTLPKKELIFPLSTLFEDEHLAVVHKPAGILVSGNSFRTIARALQQNILASTLADATIPQPVHRLDYATTGLLLVGKTSSSIRALNRLFEDKKIEKSYYAVTIGRMPDSGTIISPIDGKPSESSYRVEKTVASKRFGALNLVLLQPKTGRRHQLRKHLSEIGNPILGDKEYGQEKLILHKKGMYLHAHSLRFEHPFKKEDIHVVDSLPENFEKIFNAS